MRNLFLVLVAFSVLGCASNPTNALSDSQAECMTVCLRAQDTCFWALSAQPCDVFCGSLRLSASDRNVVCVDSLAWDHYADCRSCVVNQGMCDFPHMGGTACADVCTPSVSDDSACM